MALSSLFLESLGSFLVKKAAEPALDYTLTLVDEELRKLSEPQLPTEWAGDSLSQEQLRFIEMLPALLGDVSVWSHLRSWLRTPPPRGIVLLGPSGAGKTQIDQRLRGQVPREDVLYTSDAESRRLVFQGRRVRLIDTPGEMRHGPRGFHDLLDVLTGPKPPSLAVIVVANGWLATSMPELRGTFVRPGSGGESVAGSTDDYVEHCRAEEVKYLRQLVADCRLHATTKKIGPMPRERMRAIITVVNKEDLWGDDRKDVLTYYQDPDSEYGRALAEFRAAFGAPEQHSHDVLPAFTCAGGFHPDPTVAARALTPFHSGVGALLLRTLVSYRYTGGGRIP